MIRRGLGRAGALLVTAAFLVPAGPLPSAAADTHRLDNRVLIHVDEVSPTTPTPTTKPQQLKVTLTLTNTTDDPIEAMRVIGERGNPIGNMNQLTASTENPVPPIGGLPMPSQPPLTIDLDRHAETTVDFVTTTSTLDDGKGICICSSALTGPLIYPLFFSAHAVIDGVDNVLGFASTYLPAFYAEPEPLRVGWVWPLLDRPHRLLDDTVFTDDELATSLSSGRLSRALEVVEQVGSRVPLTLLVDPELLDEIEVMATEPYSVSQPDGKAVAGAGEAAAAAWLDRLRAVLLDDPGVTVRLTPYADPDVETLTERGLKWSTALPAAMVPRILDALAGRPLDMSLSWPVAGAVGPATLRRLYGQGIRTLLLNASAVALSGPDGSVPPGIVNLEPDRQATASQIAGVLQFPPIQREIARAITAGGEGVAALPKAVAQLAIRAVQEPDLEHAVVIAAPRYVDPDVTAAVRTIEETSDSFFARPIALQDAVADSGLSSSQLGRLTKVPSAVISDLPPTLAGLAPAISGARTVRSLLDTTDDPAAAALVAAVPEGLQRAKSSAWRAPVNADAAAAYAQGLNNGINGIRSGVHIVRPSSGTYTLASNDSPLPITITNTLRFAVHVRIQIVVPTPGLNPQPVDVVSIEGGQTKTVYVPATTERSGLFRIEVLLQAPNKGPLNDAVTLTVRSTALGVIGVIITIVAGIVLGIALLWRIFRRMRHRGATGRPPVEPLPVGTPEPVT